jgi:DNA-binding NarL/FixJ family response regulator
MTIEKPIRVLIVDDHSMFAEALSVVLDRTEDLAVMGIAGSVGRGLELARTSSPDVVLMDYRLPDRDGIEGARAFKADQPSSNVVLLTATGSDSMLRESIEAGCCGYLTKDQSIDQLTAAIRAAYRGEALISPELLSRLVVLHDDSPRIGDNLTIREVQVLQLIAEGLSNRAIAERLGISLATARNHVHGALHKLWAHNRLEAVAAAIRAGVIRLGAVP